MQITPVAPIKRVIDKINPINAAASRRRHHNRKRYLAVIPRGGVQERVFNSIFHGQVDAARVLSREIKINILASGARACVCVSCTREVVSDIYKYYALRCNKLVAA